MLLLQHGASVDAITKDQYSALHIAAKEGQDEVKLTPQQRRLLLQKIKEFVDNWADKQTEEIRRRAELQGIALPSLGEAGSEILL